MTIANENEGNPGVEMYELIKELYPICRSITGNGVRKTLDIIGKLVPLEISEVSTGTAAYDWEVPKEWDIRDAYVKNSKGEKVIDFKKNNLHVLNYSRPIKKTMTFSKLRPHLFTLPDQPDLIPYLTTYYNDNWGFCLTHNNLKSLKEDTYEVVIESTLSPGFLTYGELFVPGEIEKEILISTYICHPSMANDNLSGPVLTTFLAKEIMKTKRHYSYRFIFIPETIGALVWLSQNENNLWRIKAGLVVTCVADPGNMTYKKTKMGNSYIDKVVEKVLVDREQPFKIVDFFPTGGDERQFSSPGFNLPVGSLVRTLYGHFPEYHTSADNLNFIKSESLEDSLRCYTDVLNILEADSIFNNLNSKGEPRLGKRGLYNSIGGLKSNSDMEQAMLWVLSFSDSKTSLLDISRRSGLKFSIVQQASQHLLESGLLEKVGIEIN